MTYFVELQQTYGIEMDSVEVTLTLMSHNSNVVSLLQMC